MTGRLRIRDETALLEAVVLGLGCDCRAPRRDNFTDSHYFAAGMAPTKTCLVEQVDHFGIAFANQGVEVIRPISLPATERLSARDPAFVIDEQRFWSSLKRPDRRCEQTNIRQLLNGMAPQFFMIEPAGMLLEGGGIVLPGRKVPVGIDCTPGRRRTDPAAADSYGDICEIGK